MVNCTLPSSRDIYIEVNGKKAAVVESYRVTAVRNNKAVGAFGETSPVAQIKGSTQYTIELSKVVAAPPLGDGIDFFSLSDFNLVIVKPGQKIIYSGCEWESITESAELSGSVIEKIRLTALKRVCAV